MRSRELRDGLREVESIYVQRGVLYASEDGTEVGEEEQ